MRPTQAPTTVDALALKANQAPFGQVDTNTRTVPLQVLQRTTRMLQDWLGSPLQQLKSWEFGWGRDQHDRLWRWWCRSRWSLPKIWKLKRSDLANFIEFYRWVIPHGMPHGCCTTRARQLLAFCQATEKLLSEISGIAQSGSQNLWLPKRFPKQQRNCLSMAWKTDCCQDVSNEASFFWTSPV